MEWILTCQEVTYTISDISVPSTERYHQYGENGSEFLKHCVWKTDFDPVDKEAVARRYSVPEFVGPKEDSIAIKPITNNNTTYSGSQGFHFQMNDTVLVILIPLDWIKTKAHTFNAIFFVKLETRRVKRAE
jgi:hypothetical protein